MKTTPNKHSISIYILPNNENESDSEVTIAIARERQITGQESLHAASSEPAPEAWRVVNHGARSILDVCPLSLPLLLLLLLMKRRKMGGGMTLSQGPIAKLCNGDKANAR